MLYTNIEMDLDFIELEHRDNVRQLSEICGIDIKEAFELYAHCNCNLENAIQRQFSSPVRQPNLDQHNFEAYDEDHPIYASNTYSDFDGDQSQRAYEIFIETSMNFHKRYKTKMPSMHRSKKMNLQSGAVKDISVSSGQDFSDRLAELIVKEPNLKIEGKTLMEGLECCWIERFPLAVMLLNFDPTNFEHLKNLFNGKVPFEKTLNEQFKMIGVDSVNYKLEETLKPFFNLQKDSNHIVVLRINYIDEIERVMTIKLNDSPQNIMKHLKKAKIQCIHRELDEKHVIKEQNERRKGHHNYRRPKNIKENIKAKQDRLLRQQQEKDFYQTYKPKEESQPIRKSQTKQEKQKRKKQQVQQHRQAIRNRLKIYDSGIGFKIRLPSGKNIIISVDGEENVQYLFDFIECQQEDLGFSDELHRDFDLCVGFGGSEALKGRENEKINSIFEHAETLIVREIVL